MDLSENSIEPADGLLVTLADYVCAPCTFSADAIQVARLCLLDAIGCLAGALDDPDCVRLIGPLVPGTVVPLGARVPGTAYELDPVRAAFSTGALIRWLDFSDTTFRGGHPSDNIGAILACADFVSRREAAAGSSRLTMTDVLEGIVQAYEIQGALTAARKLDAPGVGLDAVFSVKVASAAVCTRLLGGGRREVLNALSNAFTDAGTLNTYRHPPNAGTRKGWAGADAASRGVWFAMMAVAGEMGYPAPLTARPWGFDEVVLDGKPYEPLRALGSGTIENVIFKLLPCQRNGTTAVEAALLLHPVVLPKLPAVRKITVYTHAEAIERIDKPGPLPNPAARDHSLQFMVSAALVFGELTSAHYHEPLALDPRVERLLGRMEVVEDPRYTSGYSGEPAPSCANAIEVAFDDGTTTGRVEVEYPSGDPSRRAGALPDIEQKFAALTSGKWTDVRRRRLAALLTTGGELLATPVCVFVDGLRAGA